MRYEKRVMLFGASGLLGSEIASAIRSREGYALYAPSHRQLDITDYRALDRYIKKSPPFAVINAAGMVNVDQIERDPLPAFLVNALAPAMIARILSELRPKARFIHMSTSYVFGDTKKKYRESDQPEPVNRYGETKALAENLIRCYAADSFPHYIIRASWLYSPKRKTFVDSVADSLRAWREISLTTRQSGNPTSCSDLAARLISEFLDKRPKSGIYHLLNSVDTSRGGVSRYEIGLEIARILGAPRSLVRKEERGMHYAKRPMHANLITTKVPAMRNWRYALRDDFSLLD